MKARSTRQGLGRCAAVLLALLHLGASTAFVVADAVLDSEKASAPLHVESQGSEECAAHHDHLFCQVVRSLQAAAGGHGFTVVHERGPEAAMWRPADSSYAHAAPVLVGASGPRAPPLV